MANDGDVMQTMIEDLSDGGLDGASEQWRSVAGERA